MASRVAQATPGERPATAADDRQRGVAAWLVPAALTAVAAALRLYRLDVPQRVYFDETYYVEDAVALLANGVESGFAVHPPLGKWLIGAGIGIFGSNPVGWRVAVALAGTATVWLTYLAALRLLRRRGVAALAALLVAVDGLAFTMSRIAMLDGLVALGVIAAFWLLLVDRDHTWQQVPDRPPPAADAPARPPPRPHPWRWAAVVVLAATVAVKWSGVLALGGAGAFVLVSELAFRRRTTGRALAGWPQLLGHLALAFVAVPAVLYVVSYTGWFVAYDDTRPGQERCPDEGPCDATPPERFADWAGEQAEIWTFHTDLTVSHPYRSHAVGWPLLARPVAYAYEHCTPERRLELEDEDRECPVSPGAVQHVLGLGNPAVWWLALPAYVVVAFGAARRDWRAWAIAALYLAQYVPWLVQSRPAFLFYMTPIVPFIALSVAYVVWHSMSVPRLRWWLPPLVAVLAVAAFVYWYPVLAGEELTPEAWRQRMWIPSWI